MTLLKDFRSLAERGQALELAAAIVLANATYYTITSVIDNVLLPPVGLLLGGRSVPSLFINLTPDKRVPSGPVDSLDKAQYAGAAVIAYGEVIVMLLHFLIVLALLMFVVRWTRAARSGLNDTDLGFTAPHPRENIQP